MSAPSVFELSDADGHASVAPQYVDEVPAELADAVRSACGNCPEGAITVID